MAYTTIDKPNLQHSTLLYTGDNSTNQAITGVGFQPDLTWMKIRSGSTHNHVLIDSVRGVNVPIFTNNNSGNSTNDQYGYLQSFDTDGFTTQKGSDGNAWNVNGSGTYAAFNWKAGGTAPTQTYTVKVVSDGGNKYRFDDFGTSAVTLDLQEGGTYTFDVSDSSMNSHPFVIGTAANSSEYSTGVTYKLDGVTKTYSQYTSGFSAATSRQLIITLAASAPALYYWCSVHSGMGGAINTNATHGSSNFSGSVQSLVTANTTAGFSIVSYTGTGSTATIGHGLGAAPGFILIKQLTGSNVDWFGYHKSISPSAGFKINATANPSNDTGYWNDTASTSSVFTVKDANTVNGSSVQYIAYCWAEKEGYSKFGSYRGAGSVNADDGPMIITGFKPAWVLIKNRQQSGDDWILHNNESPGYNVNNKYFYANTNNEEISADTLQLDLLSNGFKIRKSTGAFNNNNETMIYMAFGEAPLVGSNNVPATAR